MNANRSLLIKFIVFIVLMVALDFVVGNGLRHVYFKQNHGEYYKATYVFDKLNTDLIILGSSRAAHHYITKDIQDSLKLTSYNAGRDGNFLLYHYALLKSVLSRYNPKIVILDLLDNEFEKKAYPTYDRLSALLPYYKEHPEIRPIVDLRSPYEHYKLYSQIYPFNSLILASVTGYLDLHHKAIADTTLGYIPLKEVWKLGMPVVHVEKPDFDPNKVQAYRAIIQLCQQHHVKLFVVVSPLYKRYDGPDYSAIYASSIAKSAGVKFYDFSKVDIFTRNYRYFKDAEHLNDDGARIFTPMIIGNIEKAIAQGY